MDYRLLARQPRVVADHLNVLFCRQQMIQKHMEFLVHLDTGPSVTSFSTISSSSRARQCPEGATGNLADRTTNQPMKKKNVFVHLRLEPQ